MLKHIVNRNTALTWPQSLMTIPTESSFLYETPLYPISTRGSVRDATLPGQYTWTGLNDQANEGVYEWADGTEYYPTIAPYWRTGWCCFEDQDCVLSLYQQHTITQSLGEAPCDGERVFICNAPAYIAVNQAKTWSDADAYCQSQYGTHLATIFDDDSHREFLFVRDATLPNQYTWIGLNDQANEG
eukprot:91062_1